MKKIYQTPAARVHQVDAAAPLAASFALSNDQELGVTDGVINADVKEDNDIWGSEW